MNEPAAPAPRAPRADRDARIAELERVQGAILDAIKRAIDEEELDEEFMEPGTYHGRKFD